MNDNNAIIFIIEAATPEELERLKHKGFHTQEISEGWAVYDKENWVPIETTVDGMLHLIHTDEEARFYPMSKEAKKLLRVAQKIGPRGDNAVWFQELVEAWNATHDVEYYDTIDALMDE